MPRAADLPQSVRLLVKRQNFELHDRGWDEGCQRLAQAGPLKEGWRIQRDTPVYGPRRNAEELRRDLAAARRYTDR